jgi:hypothetical protein
VLILQYNPSCSCFNNIRLEEQYKVWNSYFLQSILPAQLSTIHRSRVDLRKECESCGNAGFHERK